MPLSAKHCCLAVAIALSFTALPALAQTSTNRHELSLPAQPLGDALIALGKAAHVNIAFEPASVAGLRAPVLQGNYTPGEALQQLLKGSGLSARHTADNSYAIETSPSPSAKAAGNAQAAATKRPGNDAKMLDEVRVTATVQGFSATRMPTALKDIAQSVTVIDQQTLREQNANDLDKALNWATGITLTARDSASSFYYSRGFALSNFHIDGSAQLSTNASYSQLIRTDLSQYESIELLRGADALFGGVGAPGGSINLTRKRPLPENAVSLTASAGSWDNYRVEADPGADLQSLPSHFIQWLLRDLVGGANRYGLDLSGAASAALASLADLHARAARGDMPPPGDWQAVRTSLGTLLKSLHDTEAEGPTLTAIEQLAWPADELEDALAGVVARMRFIAIRATTPDGYTPEQWAEQKRLATEINARAQKVLQELFPRGSDLTPETWESRREELEALEEVKAAKAFSERMSPVFEAHRAKASLDFGMHLHAGLMQALSATAPRA